MGELNTVVIRTSGLSSDLEHQLHARVETATGWPVHYSPTRPTDQHLDLDVLGVMFDGLSMLISAAALYFQLSDRDESTDDPSQLARQAWELTPAGDGQVDPRIGPDTLVEAVKESYGADEKRVSALKINTEHFSVVVDVDDEVLIITLTPTA